MKFPLVRELADEGFPVALTCGVLGFARQSFYEWEPGPISQRDWDDAHLANALFDLHLDDPPFGYRFLCDELKDWGHQVGENRVHRICKEHRIWSTTTKKGRKATGKTPGPAVIDDLVQRDFSAPAPDRIWLTDFTEHATPWKALPLLDEGRLLQSDRRLRHQPSSHGGPRVCGPAPRTRPTQPEGDRGHPQRPRRPLPFEVL